MPKPRIRPTTAAPPSEPSLQNLLYQASRLALTDLGKIVGARGMPVASWRVLEVLADEQGRTMSVLAAQIGMLLPTTSKLVDRMIDAALIQRSVDPDDNRRVVLHISDFGLDKFAEIQSGLEAQRQGMYAVLTSAETARLRQLLRKLIRLQQSTP